MKVLTINDSPNRVGNTFLALNMVGKEPEKHGIGNAIRWVPILIVGAIMFAILTGCTQKTKLAVYNLKCENLINPQGIDTVIPRVSWKIHGHRNGTLQAAYQIMVACRKNGLEQDRADLWDSGKILDSNSVWIPYGGKPLHPGLVYFWKVRIWDDQGQCSPWSPVAEFSIGLLSRGEWKASFITLQTAAGYRECPQLKKSFDVQDLNQKTLLHVNSLGYHEAYLNGKKIGEGVLAPAVCQFDKRSRVITYDLTPLLQKGQNMLMLWLGSGWYTYGLPGVSNDGPVVRAQMERVSGDSREIVMTTDSTWMGRKSAYTRQGNWLPHQFGGEILDGSLAQHALQTDDAAGGDWAPVTIVDLPSIEATPQMVEQNRIIESWHPAKIEKIAPDTLLVDMGRNLTGWFTIHFPPLRQNQEVTLEYCDHLDPSGKFVDQRQTDRYLAAGLGNEMFTNKFNYHGFRYVRIANLPQIPAIDSLSVGLISTGYEAASSFSCSDPELNRIHNMIAYTLRCLSLGGYLVDCPQMERLGYGGDGNASTATAQLMYGLNPLYKNWLQAWADCIRADGGMPHTAPNPYPAGGGPYWCGFIITASWNTYQQYGDLSILEHYYPVMQKWLGFVDAHTVGGLLKKWPDTNYRGWYLGDWASPEGVDQTAETAIDLVNNCFIVVCLDRMQHIAGALNHSADAASYETRKSSIQKRIHQQFFHPETNSYGTGTQIEQTYPLLAGVVPDSLIRSVTQTLTHLTEQKYAGHLACGLVGIPVLTQWAINSQSADLIYNMLKKEDYPGYLYMINHGATTTWEHWNGSRSQIHNCYNGIGQWFYQALGGIRPENDQIGWREYIIQPQIPTGVTWAKTKIESPLGTIGVDWELRDNKLFVETFIPVGAKARVCLPEQVRSIRINNQLMPGSSIPMQLTSGHYQIQADM